MSLKPHKNIIRQISQFEKLIHQTKNLSNIVFQDLNFMQTSLQWSDYQLKNSVFIGCILPPEIITHIFENGGYYYPKFPELPYNPFRSYLYDWKELMENNTDFEIYDHFSKSKYNTPINEALAQRIHDHSIDVALRKLIGFNEEGMTTKKCVGFMGGHSAARGSEFYTKTALSAKYTAEAGFYVVTGGGPGIMEAANLGAYFAHQPDENLVDAIQILSLSPTFTDENYIKKAQEVLVKYPIGHESLAIPTWFYGHEPSNLFATFIAKYFSNSLREDILLAISIYGVVFAPGSAGTTQEIFQEAAQNHYGTFGYHSPMIFLSKKRYVEDTSIYSVLHQLSIGMPYKSMLYLTDAPNLLVDFLLKHPPIKV